MLNSSSSGLEKFINHSAFSLSSRLRGGRTTAAADEEPVDEEPVDEEPVDEEPVDEEGHQGLAGTSYPNSSYSALIGRFTTGWYISFDVYDAPVGTIAADVLDEGVPTQWYEGVFDEGVLDDDILLQYTRILSRAKN